MRLWAHGSHFPKRCGEDGADSGLLTSPGLEEEKKPGCWAGQPPAPSTWHMSHKEEGKVAVSGSQWLLQSGSLPALVLPVPEPPISARDPRGHGLAPPVSAPSDKGCSRWAPAHLCCLATRCVPWMAPGRAPPRKGQRQQGWRPPGGLSQCVLSCLFYTLLSRMRREMNQVVAVSGGGGGRGGR